MARPTKSEVERTLLTGQPVNWRKNDGSRGSLVLGEPSARRLFEFLLRSDVRRPVDLTANFIEALAVAYAENTDPALTVKATDQGASTHGPWRLKSIATEGFGGLNIWGGPTFRHEFDTESLLVEGPNGSGKSSLVGAILWALSGERPRDQLDVHAHEPKPVFSIDENQVGNWPPIACYPTSVTNLKLPPRVVVQLVFENPSGGTASVERILDGGRITTTVDPGFKAPSALLDAGLLMPARLAQIRFSEGSNRLRHAVQKLTGLDDFVAIGVLVEGLCHKGREYLSYHKRELADASREFARAIAETRKALGPLEIPVQDFTPADTNDPKGGMAVFGKSTVNRAAELARVVSNDLAPGLVLTTAAVQHRVISAVEAAKQDVEVGLEGLPSWRLLRSLSGELTGNAAKELSEAAANARSRLSEASSLHQKAEADSKFQLKALAAKWHIEHGAGTVENCPLCEQTLSHLPSLKNELEILRSSGEAAARTYQDNLNAILNTFDSSLPDVFRTQRAASWTFDPRAAIVSECAERFVTDERYVKILAVCGTLIQEGLNRAPLTSLPLGEEISAGNPELVPLLEKLAVAERSISLAEWFQNHHAQWIDWWSDLSGIGKGFPEHTPQTAASELTSPPSESLSTHLQRLSEALTKAEPFGRAAEAMRTAWKEGKKAAAIEKELALRERIVASMAPLKSLCELGGAVAREAVEGLSERIGDILKRIHITEELRFGEARLLRREGLVVRAGFVPDLRIDATLVANASWLRAVLWAFLFAVREEAIDQLGSDPFPLLVLDDPQSTFDREHRHRWTQYVAALQSGASRVQVILATHDETFLELIKIDGMTGRQAVLTAAGPELGHVGIFEGESLARNWNKAQAARTPQAGRDYIASVREYVEGLLRLMLRGHAAAVMAVGNGTVLGGGRSKLGQLNSKGIAPWDRDEFKKLITLLAKDQAPIKHMEMAHHASGSHLGMAEAEDVESHWREKLRPSLEKCFRSTREYNTLHGGLRALHEGPPTTSLPEGYCARVRQIPLRRLGRAAALSDGTVSDGRLDFDEFAIAEHKKVTLAQHAVYRLMSNTLEPVARRGDLLLVRVSGEPTVRSLVVALSDDRILARRFEIAENHSDIAVLAAYAIDPRQIAPPLVAHKATVQMHKIVGVFYDSPSNIGPSRKEAEVCECVGEAALANLAANALGVVEVIGHSAVPYALDGQHLVVKGEVALDRLDELDGKPIIGCDTNENYYFKRLRLAGDCAVLESMDIGGDYAPIVLGSPGNGANCLSRVWPVAGVLFELPA